LATQLLHLVAATIALTNTPSYSSRLSGRLRAQGALLPTKSLGFLFCDVWAIIR
jgi:hypothetical protein